MARLPRIEGTFLRSRVGRRIFLMFCLAAVLPAAIVFWLTYRTAARSAYEASHAAMSEENKHYALTVFERLQAARATLQSVGTPASDSGEVREPLLDHFSPRSRCWSCRCAQVRGSRRWRKTSPRSKRRSPAPT